MMTQTVLFNLLCERLTVDSRVREDSSTWQLKVSPRVSQLNKWRDLLTAAVVIDGTHYYE